MGGKGPVPQGYSGRERDQKRRGTQNVLVDDGVTRGLALPEGRAWHRATLDWWETWRRSPQAQLWTPTDWDFALETAILRDEYVRRPGHLAAAELRQRAAKMGATYEDRMRLKMSIVDEAPPDETAPGVTAIGAYRDRLTG